MDHRLTTTALTIPGYRVTRTLGVVRGVTVRARWIGSQITASLRTLGGGQIPEYIELCEQTRAEAFAWMVQHAEQMGANAIIAMKYDATDLGNNMTEVLAYGTAAVVEPDYECIGDAIGDAEGTPSGSRIDLVEVCKRNRVTIVGAETCGVQV